MKQNLLDCITWMVDQIGEKFHGIVDKRFLSTDVMPAAQALYEQAVHSQDFYVHIAVKNELRYLYRYVNAFYIHSIWQAPGINARAELKHAGCLQAELNKYNRVHNAPMINEVRRQFENEFYKGQENSLSYLTNSGMSALELGAKLANYMQGEGSILVQSEQYYEIPYLAKSLFHMYEECSVQDIYKRLQSDEIIRCILVGYAPAIQGDIRFDLDMFLRCLCRHRQKQVLTVIIDRTYFSLVDGYEEKLRQYSFDKNIVFISGESLNKNHQYGLDGLSLGYCRVDSKRNAILSALGFMDHIYSTGTMRPELSALAGALSFNAAILLLRFQSMCRNTAYLLEYLNRQAYHVSYLYQRMDEHHGIYGNVLFIILNVDYGRHQKALTDILMNQRILVLGTSFGFDVSRAEFIDIGGNKTLLRISVGVEPEVERCKVAKEVHRILQEAMQIATKNREQV